MQSSILIVGAQGQDAKILSELYKAKNLRVIALEKSGVYDDYTLIATYQKLDCAVLAKIIKDYKVKKIFFTASKSLDRKSRTEIELLKNFYMFKEIEALLEVCLEACAYSGSEVDFVLFSSGLRFESLSGLIDENSSVLGRDIYTKHKIYCEQLTLKYSKVTNCIKPYIIYFFNHVSIYSKPYFLLPKIASAVLSKDKFWLEQELSKAQEDLDFVDIGCAHQYMKILMNLLESGESGNYIIATGITVPTNYFFEAGISILLNSPLPNTSKKYKIPFTIDNSKLLNALGVDDFRFINKISLLKTLLN
jgi:GDP-D-mannose dehydratase